MMLLMALREPRQAQLQRFLCQQLSGWDRFVQQCRSRFDTVVAVAAAVVVVGEQRTMNVCLVPVL